MEIAVELDEQRRRDQRHLAVGQNGGSAHRSVDLLSAARRTSNTYTPVVKQTWVTTCSVTVTVTTDASFGTGKTLT